MLLKDSAFLILTLTRKEIVERYRGGILGFAWLLLYPLLILGIYTFVFSTILQIKWNTGQDQTNVNFALLLFIGLTIHMFLSEIILKSPNLILGNRDIVKKTPLPIEVFSISCLVTALFNLLLSLFAWLLFFIFFQGLPSMTILWMPVVLLPLVILGLGISLFMASLGVFFRDLNQISGLVVTALLFLAPVFYPLDAVPDQFRDIVYLNPITFIIEQIRAVAVHGVNIAIRGYLTYFAVSLFVLFLGFTWFRITKKLFNDAI